MEKLQIYEIIEKQWPLKQGMRVERFFRTNLRYSYFYTIFQQLQSNKIFFQTLFPSFP